MPSPHSEAMIAFGTHISFLLLCLCRVVIFLHAFCLFFVLLFTVDLGEDLNGALGRFKLPECYH